MISHLERISRPSVRRYANKDNIPRVIGGRVSSHFKGLMTDKQAREQGMVEKFFVKSGKSFQLRYRSMSRIGRQPIPIPSGVQVLSISSMSKSKVPKGNWIISSPRPLLYGRRMIICWWSVLMIGRRIKPPWNSPRPDQ